MAMKKVVRRQRKASYVPLNENSPPGAEKYVSLEVMMANDPELEKRYRAHEEFARRLMEAAKEEEMEEEAGVDQRPYLSEPVPAQNDGPLAIVVADNFTQVVMDSDKDVLLVAYSPACPHCKALAPTLDELSRRFKDVPSVTIAMMNTDENTPFVAGHRNGEVLDEIDRVPTLLLYAAHPGKGGPEWSFGDYVVEAPENMDRSLSGLTKWILTHAQTQFQLPQEEREEGF